VKRLIDLLQGVGNLGLGVGISQTLIPNHQTPITGITANSAEVKDGYIFVALKGEKTDGADFIPQAIERGAAVIIGLEALGLRLEENIASQATSHKPQAIFAKNPRLALAKLSAAFYEKQPEHIVAITGTDGKTSTADFFRQLMFLCGKKSASMGTIGVVAGDGTMLREGTLTTPDPVALHKTLAEFEGAGISHIAMEASSHGLFQYRLDGVNLQAATFTNIARDHLDFHGTEENYFAAKARLFSEVLPAGKTAVLNADDAKFPELKAICEARGQRVIDYGKTAKEFYIRAITPHGAGQSVLLTLFGKKYNVEVPLVGAFQVMNILAALGLAVGVGEDVENVLQHISQLKGVAGRLQQVAALSNGASVFIDYAHTPAALANILNTLRPHTAGKLSVVFGCGGNRDKGKRPLMGEVASRLADFAIITDDNPRDENPAQIRAEVLVGAPNCQEIGDRKEAIYAAIQQLKAGDVLVIAGKGHEKTQIIGSKNLPFDDAEIAKKAAKDLGLLA
jgi:UDP-N-acetylmuramoyl-L-alanyl-D-glutamate--2,6-diaminopimelate ligase